MSERAAHASLSHPPHVSERISTATPLRGTSTSSEHDPSHGRAHTPNGTASSRSTVASGVRSGTANTSR